MLIRTFCYFPHRASVSCFMFWSVALFHLMEPAFLHSDRESQRVDSESLSSCLKVQQLTFMLTLAITVTILLRLNAHSHFNLRQTVKI